MSRRNEPSLGRIVLLVVAAIVLLPLVMMAFAVPMMGMMGWWWMDGTMGGSGVWMLLMGVLWLLVILGGGYLVVRALTGHVGPDSSDPALEELRAAYARGDLTDEEFEKRREKLERD